MIQDFKCFQILQYSQGPVKLVKGKPDADLGSSRQLPPENLTCHFGFGIETLRAWKYTNNINIYINNLFLWASYSMVLIMYGNHELELFSVGHPLDGPMTF